MMVKNKLLAIRLSLGYKKQKDFAKFLNIAETNYNKWENNSSQPSLKVVLRMAKILNMKVEDIVFLEDEVD